MTHAAHSILCRCIACVELEKADNRLNPAIVDLFPYPAHLQSFRLAVVFDSRAAQYITKAEQLTLAQSIIEKYRNTILSCHAIHYETLRFLEKKDPAKFGTQRSSLLSKPATVSRNIYSELTDEPSGSGDNSPYADLTEKKISSANPFTKRSPKEIDDRTIYERWNNAQSGTIHASQTANSNSQQISIYDDLCNDETDRNTAQCSADKAPIKTLGNLFAKKLTETKASEVKPAETPAVEPIRNSVAFRDLFAKKSQKASEVKPAETPAVEQVAITKDNMARTFCNLFRKR